MKKVYELWPRRSGKTTRLILQTYQDDRVWMIVPNYQIAQRLRAEHPKLANRIISILEQQTMREGGKIPSEAVFVVDEATWCFESLLGRQIVSATLSDDVVAIF